MSKPEGLDLSGRHETSDECRIFQGRNLPAMQSGQVIRSKVRQSGRTRRLGSYGAASDFPRAVVFARDQGGDLSQDSEAEHGHTRVARVPRRHRSVAPGPSATFRVPSNRAPEWGNRGRTPLAPSE